MPPGISSISVGISNRQAGRPAARDRRWWHEAVTPGAQHMEGKRERGVGTAPPSRKAGSSLRPASMQPGV
eukprot:SAG11_NODE_12296_length_710_cov_1.427169_1_plen_69_part_10